MIKTYPNDIRRPKVTLSPYIANYLQVRNPWAVAWWSAAFPGAGHFLLCKYLTGSLLMVWEFVINYQAHINEGILYSMIGNFDMAKAVIDTRWFLLYIIVFIFTIWDAYSLAIDLNKYSMLADRSNAPIQPFKIGPIEIHFLDTRKPWTAAFWGFFSPGLESLYANRLPMGFFALTYFILVVYQSNVLNGIHLTFEGNPELAATVIDPQWFLNLPSLMFFAASSGHQDIVFTNKLFKIEQARYFIANFQPKAYKMPVNNKKENSMHVISTFRHSAYIELALNDLEQKGIHKENIFVAPLNKYSRDMSDLEKAHKEGSSKYEPAFISGAIFMLLGSIYGFVLAWGPIIWAIIGLLCGIAVGMIISFIIKKTEWQEKKAQTEVVLIIECETKLSELVEGILWRHKALGVSKTS